MADRGMSAAMNAAIQDQNVSPVLLFDGEFTSGAVHFWTGIGVLDWTGTLYTGLGEFLSVSDFEETNEIKSGGITVSLAGVTSGKIALALGEMRRYLPGTIWLGLLDDAGLLIDDPWPLFRGRLNTCSIDDGEETAVINVSYDHENVSLENPVVTRYTDEEQRRLFPGDTGLSRIVSLQNKVLRWGATK